MNIDNKNEIQKYFDLYDVQRKNIEKKESLISNRFIKNRSRRVSLGEEEIITYTKSLNCSEYGSQRKRGKSAIERAILNNPLMNDSQINSSKSPLFWSI